MDGHTTNPKRKRKREKRDSFSLSSNAQNVEMNYRPPRLRHFGLLRQTKKDFYWEGAVNSPHGSWVSSDVEPWSLINPHHEAVASAVEESLETLRKPKSFQGHVGRDVVALEARNLSRFPSLWRRAWISLDSIKWSTSDILSAICQLREIRIRGGMAGDRQTKKS